MQHFQLSKVPMVGASGGGLAAMLATCEVDPEEVMESAYRLSKQHNIWERPLGLMGTWGYVIEEWLDELLPADAAERCRDQVGSWRVRCMGRYMPCCSETAAKHLIELHLCVAEQCSQAAVLHVRPLSACCHAAGCFALAISEHAVYELSLADYLLSCPLLLCLHALPAGWHCGDAAAVLQPGVHQRLC
jgi:hypothetical protein